jgi:hypothetical protein
VLGEKTGAPQRVGQFVCQFLLTRRYARPDGKAEAQAAHTHAPIFR